MCGTPARCKRFVELTYAPNKFDFDTLMRQLLAVPNAYRDLCDDWLTWIQDGFVWGSYLAGHRVTIVIHRRCHGFLLLSLHIDLLAVVLTVQLHFHIYRRGEEVRGHFGYESLSNVQIPGPGVMNRVY